MQKKLKKNIKQRYYFKNFEKKRLILKSIILNNNIKKKKRWKIQQKFFNFNKNNSITQINNVCILSNRSRSIFKFFKISRIFLRKLTSNGYLPGIYKYNW